MVGCGDDTGAGAQNAGGGGSNPGGQSAGGESAGGESAGGAGGENAGGAGGDNQGGSVGEGGAGGQAPACGDGDVTAGEGCDDGDLDDGDGCSGKCAQESGWTCTGEPSVCVTPTLVAINATGEYYRVNTSTGAATMVGSLGFGNVYSLARGPTGLFTVESDTAQAMLRIIAIDPLTGTGTAGASLSSNTLNFRGFAISDAGVAFGLENISNDLYSIDLVTGVAAAIGDSGANEVQALDFTSDGTLYGWNAVNGLALNAGLVTLNTTTGASTDVSALNGGTTSAASALATAPGETSLYLATGTELFSVARATGAFTLIGAHGIGTGGPTGLEVIDLPAPAP